MEQDDARSERVAGLGRISHRSYQATAKPGTTVTIGDQYRSERFHAYKAYDCAGNQIVVLFSAFGSGPIRALVVDGQRRRVFGHLNAAETQALVSELD